MGWGESAHKDRQHGGRTSSFCFLRHLTWEIQSLKGTPRRKDQTQLKTETGSAPSNAMARSPQCFGRRLLWEKKGVFEVRL